MFAIACLCPWGTLNPVVLSSCSAFNDQKCAYPTIVKYLKPYHICYSIYIILYIYICPYYRIDSELYPISPQHGWWLIPSPILYKIPQIWCQKMNRLISKPRFRFVSVFQIKGMRWAWDSFVHIKIPHRGRPCFLHVFGGIKKSKPQSQWVDTFLLSSLEVLRFFACPTVALEKLADTSVVLVGFDPDLGESEAWFPGEHPGFSLW